MLSNGGQVLNDLTDMLPLIEQLFPNAKYRRFKGLSRNLHSRVLKIDITILMSIAHSNKREFPSGETVEFIPKLEGIPPALVVWYRQKDL